MAYKQVLIIRNDLKLPKGKLAAQIAHASVDAYTKAESIVSRSWFLEGQKKIVVKVQTEKELILLFQSAKDQGIPASLITDAGKTVVAPGTKTAVGLGPADEDVLDDLTGDLSLL